MLRALWSVFLLVACTQNGSVVRQAAENPLKGGATLVLEPLSFAQLKLEIMSEEVYLGRYAGRPEMRSYQEDKVVMDKNFRDGVQAQVPQLIGAGPLKLKAQAVVIYPGGDMNLRTSEGVRNNTRGTFKVMILSPENAVLDELLVEVGVAATQTKVFAADRMREMGTLLAQQVADYLKKRAAGTPTN